MIKTSPNMPVAPPSGQQSTKPASPPKAPSVKPPTPMGKSNVNVDDEAYKARNEVIKQGHEEHRKKGNITPLVGKPLEELHRKAWKAHDDKYKELTGTWIGPHHSGNYLHTPTEKSEKSNSKTHVKEFIVPISKGGMLRWHSACIKGDDSAKGQVIKGRSPDAEYSREAASGLPGVCTGCSGELGKDPNNVPVPPQDLSTEKSEADIANLSMAQDKAKSKFLDPLKHHYAHLLQAHKLGKGEQANKSANMCAVYLRLLDIAAVPEELKNNSGVNLSKTEHPFDKEARKLAKTLTMDAGSGVPSSDTQGAAMVKDETNHLEQAKKLHKEGLKGWGNDYTITDRGKAVQAIALYRKGGHNHLANHLQSVLDNKTTKDLSVRKEEDMSTFQPLDKMRGYMNRLAKCGEMAVVKAEHNPKGIQNPNTSGQGYHADHADNPYHNTIVSHGYKYSHSTPVTDMDGQKNLHHTYKHDSLKDHNVSVAMKGNKAHHWSVSVGSSGRETRDDNTNKLLDSFLKNHVSRAKNLAKCGEMAVVKAEHNPKGIQNPNTSGQGYHADHADNPYHNTIVSHGYKYSHSTPVYGPSVTTKLGSPPERNIYLHHTYKHGTLKDHNVSVAMKGDKPHHWAVSVSGSGLETRGNDPQKLNSFLKGHISRAKKKAI